MIKRKLTFCLWCVWFGLLAVGFGPMAVGFGVHPVQAMSTGGESAWPAADIALAESTERDETERYDHPYYVSLVNMYWNEETRTYQVSIRLFWDDLEQALEEKHGEKAYLATEWEIEQANEWIFGYLAEHMKVWGSGAGAATGGSGGGSGSGGASAIAQSDQPVSWTWIGREDEMDVAWCYMESEPINDPKEIALDVSIFHELFRTQTNIVYVKLDEEDKNMLFRRGRGKTDVDW